MVYRMCALALAIVLLWVVQPVHACEPPPWSYESLAKESDSLVLGNVSSASSSGRQATIEVISYIGQEPAPKTIRFTTTSSRKSTDDPCPDFSMVFQKGMTYLFFLKHDGQSLKLLHPDGVTALHVQNEQVVLNVRGDTGDVNELLLQYATEHQMTVQKPEPDGVVWGKVSNHALAYSAAAAAGIVLIAACFYVMRRKKRF